MTFTDIALLVLIIIVCTFFGCMAFLVKAISNVKIEVKLSRDAIAQPTLQEIDEDEENEDVAMRSMDVMIQSLNEIMTGQEFDDEGR